MHARTARGALEQVRKTKLSAQCVSLHKSDLFTIQTLSNLLRDCGAVVHPRLVFVS